MGKRKIDPYYHCYNPVFGPTTVRDPDGNVRAAVIHRSLWRRNAVTQTVRGCWLLLFRDRKESLVGAYCFALGFITAFAAQDLGRWLAH